MEKRGIALLNFDKSGSSQELIPKYREIIEHYKSQFEKVVIISHNTVAKIDSEKNVLDVDKCSSGTYMSSALVITLGEIISRYSSYKKEDIAIVIAGDGDNWSEDREKTCKLIGELSKYGYIYYHEIYPNTYTTHMSNFFVLDGLDVKIFKIADSKRSIFGESLIEKIEYNISIEISKNENIINATVLGKGIRKKVSMPYDENKDKYKQIKSISGKVIATIDC